MIMLYKKVHKLFQMILGFTPLCIYPLYLPLPLYLVCGF